MAFGEFRYPDVIAQFELTYAAADDLFAGVPAVEPTPATRNLLTKTVRLAAMLDNEKAWGEWLIAPLLADCWGRFDGQVGLYSGAELQADPDAGLSGFVPFTFSRGPQHPLLIRSQEKRAGSAVAGLCEAGPTGVTDPGYSRQLIPGVRITPAVLFTPPLLLVFQAKKDNIPEGLGQCIAGLVGAQRFNRSAGNHEPHLYGCVTTGSLWQFLRLSGTTLTLDLNEYNLGQLDRILGVIASIVAPPLPAAAA